MSRAFVARSAPQLAAFREAWTRQVRRVLDDAALFDQCPDANLAESAELALRSMAGEETAVARAVGEEAGWLELFVAEARCRFVSLRPSGDCAALGGWERDLAPVMNLDEGTRTWWLDFDVAPEDLPAALQVQLGRSP